LLYLDALIEIKSISQKSAAVFTVGCILWLKNICKF
jgi:hypothetical protein